jgi:AraC-like DNA-binding protein
MESRKELYIKNMVCNRCIKVISDEFNKLGAEIEDITLGIVVLKKALNADRLNEIRKTLIESGFELIDDRKSRIIDKIKTEIINIIYSSKEFDIKINMSGYLASKTGYDYSYISNLFSSVEGKTIEQYIINQKIERVKELLVYDELTLTEISYKLGYKSVQHLSTQFKIITGLNPSYFKKLKNKKRISLDEI